MRKLSKAVAAACAAMTFAASLNVSAFADDSPKQNVLGYEKRSVTAHIFEKDKTQDLNCIFADDMPAMPYIDAQEYLDVMFTVDFETDKADDGIYTITGNDTTITIDPEKDTIKFSDYKMLTDKNVTVDEINDDFNYFNIVTDEEDNKKNGSEFDLSKYDIDIIEDDENVYIPSYILNDLFSSLYSSVVYSGDELYFTKETDFVYDIESYYDIDLYKNDERSEEDTARSYNELCFLFDRIYGAPGQSKLAKSISEKGFDKTLDEYSDDTRLAKQYLLGNSWSDHYIGILLISPLLHDGGHTLPLAELLNNMQESEDDPVVIKNFREKIKKMGSDRARNALEEVMNSMSEDILSDDLETARDLSFKKLDELKKWSDSSLYGFGQTAVFSFDGFDIPVVKQFKEAVDIAKKKGYKNFLIDLSLNGGGELSVLGYIMSAMTKEDKKDNTFSFYSKNVISGETYKDTYEYDYDLNDVIDEEDKSVDFKMNYAVLCSKISFSCGNYLPCLAKDNGIPVIGQRTGGGSCSIMVERYMDNSRFTMSGFSTLLNNELEDVDTGVEPDLKMPLKKAEFGYDADSFYDFEKINSYLDDFYGVEVEEAEEVEEPEDSEEQTDKDSSQTEKETKDDTKDNTEQQDKDDTSAVTEVSTTNTANPKTAAGFGVSAGMIAAAAAVITICSRSRRKK